MHRKSSLEPSTPVHFVLRNGMLTEGNQWSGREDSNLRPLPPERISPSRTRARPVTFQSARLPSSGACSRAVPGARFKTSLRPLSIIRMRA